MSKKVIIGISLAFIMFVITGCGAPSTLEEYINSNEDAKSTIDSLASGNMKVDITDNTLTYTYTYNQTFTGDTLEKIEEELEKAMEEQSSTFENIGTTLEKESGVSDVKVVVEYLNKDGSKIYSEEF